MRLWHLLRARLRSMFFRAGREADLDEELRLHIDREIERLESSGVSPALARRQALSAFGGVEHIKDACRDERGTAFLDNTVRDIRYALRGFARAPVPAVTIICTIALGLGLVAVAFSILSMLLFRVDRVPGVEDMFTVARPRGADGERPRYTRAEFDSLRRDTAVFSGIYAQVADVDSRLEQDGRTMFGTYVTGDFFQVLRVNAMMGRTLTPYDAAPGAGGDVVVLSHRGWDRLFARDPDIIGRRVRVHDVTVEVVGVMPEGFRGLAVGQPDDYWAPLSTLERVQPRSRRQGDARSVDIVGRLRPDMSKESAQAALSAWATRHPDGSPIERSASGVTLLPRRGTVEQTYEAMLVTAPLFFACGLVLLIGCANVTNLLLARGIARQREIGVRLALGATRRRIVRQLLTESVLLALIAAALGFAISRVGLDITVSAMMTSWPPEIGDLRMMVPEPDWRVGVFLVVVALVATATFGTVPALHATRIEPLRTIRGEVVGDDRPTGGKRARSVLIGLQVSASALLLVTAAIFLRSAIAGSTVDPGLRLDNTVMVQLAQETSREAVVRAVVAEPLVDAVAASSPGVLSTDRLAVGDSGAVKATIGYRFVSPEYFDVLGIPLVHGRAFTAAERSPDESVAVVSESTARTLWPNSGAVGKSLLVVPDAATDARPGAGSGDLSHGARTVTIVGVVRDVAGFRIAPLKKAVVYVPTNTAVPATSLVVRVHGDPQRAKEALSTRLAAIDINVGEVGALLWITKMETYLLRVGFWFAVVLGGLALALTVSGLFSVLSHLVEQRTKEIGVRMALGATTKHVTRLVLSQSLKPVGLGLLVGAGSVAAMAAVLLSTSAAAAIGGMVRVFDPAAYAVSLLVIVAACLFAAAIPASRAAHLDPTRTLRQD